MPNTADLEAPADNRPVLGQPDILTGTQDFQPGNSMPTHASQILQPEPHDQNMADPYGQADDFGSHGNRPMHHTDDFMDLMHQEDQQMENCDFTFGDLDPNFQFDGENHMGGEMPQDMVLMDNDQDQNVDHSLFQNGAPTYHYSGSHRVPSSPELSPLGGPAQQAPMPFDGGETVFDFQYNVNNTDHHIAPDNRQTKNLGSYQPVSKFCRSRGEAQLTMDTRDAN